MLGSDVECVGPVLLLPLVVALCLVRCSCCLPLSLFSFGILTPLLGFVFLLVASFDLLGVVEVCS